MFGLALGDLCEPGALEGLRDAACLTSGCCFGLEVLAVFADFFFVGIVDLERKVHKLAGIPMRPADRDSMWYLEFAVVEYSLLAFADDFNG
jgi:hypothetical protein